MRRYANLYPIFVSFLNLLSAYQKAKKGTRTNVETTAYFYQLETELFALQEKLIHLTYQPAPYHYFQIYDPKERTISVAIFQDRVVHHALVNVLEIIYESLFIYDSYATRKGKGTHAAVNRAKQFLRRKRWFLKTDINKFFDSISHDHMIAILGKKIKDKKLMEIASRIIRNGGREGKGLPIGNLTSQFFANVYLHELDRFIKQELRVKHYIRYMDDFVLFEEDKERLKTYLQKIEEFLDQKLELKLKKKATYINSASNGLTFLGRRIFPGIVRLAQPNLRRMQKKITARQKQFERQLVSEETFLQSMNSYWAMLSVHDTYQLRKTWQNKDQG